MIIWLLVLLLLIIFSYAVYRTNFISQENDNKKTEGEQH